MNVKSDKCSREWHRIKTQPTQVIRINGADDAGGKLTGNVNRW